MKFCEKEGRDQKSLFIKWPQSIQIVMDIILRMKFIAEKKYARTICVLLTIKKEILNLFKIGSRKFFLLAKISQNLAKK